MTNLGEQLRQNIAREAKSLHDEKLAIELARTEEERANRVVVKAFFDKARDFFSKGITLRKPVDSLFLQLGGERYSNVNDYHPDVTRILRIYKYTTKGPSSLSDPSGYGPFWDAFQAWATEQGLQAYWQYEYSGGGEDSWFQLRVRPLA